MHLVTISVNIEGNTPIILSQQTERFIAHPAKGERKKREYAKKNIEEE